MPLSKQYKTIFVHIPKTAGTSIELALGLHGDKTFIGVNRYWDQQGQKENLFGGKYQHLTIREIKKILPSNVYSNFFRFTFTRNPWDRLVSHLAWKDGKWAKQEPLSKDYFEQNLFHFYERYQWNKRLIQRMRRWYKASSIYQGNLALWEHQHLTPQYCYTHNWLGKTELNYIGKFEKLEENWKIVCRHLKSDLPLKRRMVSTHEDYRTYYSKRTKRIVEEIYQKDIRMFSYEF